MQAEKFSSGAGEQLRLLVWRKILERFNERAWMRLPQRERIVGAKRDALGPEKFDEQFHRIWVVDE